MLQLLPIAFAAVVSGCFLLGIILSASSLYGIIALGYFISGATECYDKDKGIGNVLKSRFTPEDGLSFTSIIKAIGTCLWIPFFLFGGLCGMAVRAIANLFSGSKKNPETPQDNKTSEEHAFGNNSSYSTLVSSLGHPKPKPTDIKNPEHTEVSPTPVNLKQSPSEEKSSDFIYIK
jgi:hypothetical protein